MQLTPGENPPHEIDIAADSAAALAMTPETETHFRRLVAETGALFGVRALSRLPFPAHAQR